VFHSVEGFVISFYSGGDYFVFGESCVDCFKPPGLDFLVSVYVFPSILVDPDNSLASQDPYEVGGLGY
jgi:hypothetical protein